MNKIFKVIYSKTRHCYVVVSELAKSHVKSSHGNGGQQKAVLTMSVLLALGAFTFAFGPANAEAADENHYTEGQQYIGVYHTSNDTANAENHQGGLVSKNQGALGVGAISIGVHAEAGTGTITIGNRLAPSAQDSVFIGSKYDAENKVYKTASSKVVSIGADSNASGTGSVALGYGAEADVSNVSGKEKNPDKESQSIAIGYKATAKQNNIAIGANSVATDAASKETAKFRDNTDSDYNAPSSYVSVGSSTLKRRITNVAAGADENDVATVGQLKKVADNKIAWKLTTAGDSNNASTVSAGDTVDFSAAKDSKENGQVTGKDHSNLTISKEKENGTNKVNMTVGLSDNVVLGQNVSRKGGSLDVYRAVGDASSDTETNENNQSYDQLGSHVRIDGSTVSVHYDNGTDSDARGAVLGIANDSYQDTNDATKTVSSPLGYVYLQDGRNYYYLHGAMHGDTKYQGRLAYDSSESGYNYIANLDDGIKFSGDTKKDEKAVTVDTKLDSNAANNTLSITGGADVSDTTKLTNGNIGAVATTNETDSTTGEVKKAGGLSIQLAKNLTGIMSISNQPTSATTTGAKLELGTNGTTISGGDVNVSKNKITGLKDGTDVTDAATVGQMNTAIGNAKTKYYSVTNSFKLGDYRTNENNDGATDDALAGMAAGYETGTTGIASTVAGSYSGVIGSGLQGAAAVSVGTVNVNNNTGTKDSVCR
ncbi:ESPR-type extended signal peptide-containing protein [Megasphaera elsdenii]|uniref:ESPR-type extended signal peptide-containing protein n=1 Tax=Megasphaera elsdenii TaxID=907 RepID=UPI0039F540C6